MQVLARCESDLQRPDQVTPRSDSSTSDNEQISVERLIDAPPEQIFDRTADPTRHHDFDGSGAVHTLKTGPQRLALGSTFVMSMRMFIRYSTVSTVVEFEENRRIAWQTYSTIKWLAKWGGGRIWSYELQPEQEGTLVRETWNFATEAPHAKKNLAKERTGNYMINAMERSLVLLEETASR
jgi:uncharacterized protein YndB with AHSA1/START domain